MVADLPTFSDLAGYRAEGIRIWAPPTFALLALDGSNRIVASQAARDAKEAGLDIITWTLERSGILADGNNGFYYQTIEQAITREGDLYKVLDVLAKDVGISWRVFRLGRARHLLRQLHGLEVAQRPLPGTPFEPSLKDETTCHFCNRHRTVLVLRAIEFVRLFGPRP